MFVPDNKSSSERMLDLFGTYLASRLQASPEVTSLSVMFDKAQASLTAANERQRKAYRAQQNALATRDDVAFQMDRLITYFHRAVLTHLNGNRADPLYRRYFPTGVGPLATISLQKLIDVVKWLETDLASTADAVALKSWAQKLADQRIALEKTIASLQAARIALTGAQKLEETERANWVNVYRTIHAKLVELHPSDRRKVESFFRPGRKSRRAESPPPEDETRVRAPAAGREENPAA